MRGMPYLLEAINQASRLKGQGINMIGRLLCFPDVTENEFKSIKTKFMKNVKKTKDCWEWAAGKTNGYGVMYIGEKQYRAHRISWWLFGNDFIDLNQYLVCHKCDNPSCVNPNHLFLGTDKDNIHDCKLKGRRHNQNGELNGSNKLTKKKVLRIKKLKTNGIGCYKLAKMFDVSPKQIYNIINGVSWRHLC